MPYSKAIGLMDQSINQILRAAAFAAHKHRDQRRKDDAASPYINHPIALANILSNEGGISDPAVLVAFAAAQVPKLKSADADDGAQPNEEDNTTSDVSQSFVGLAQLTRVEYDQVRKAEAKAHGIQLQTLDHEVSRLRKELTSEATLTFKDPDPWSTKVNGSELLSRIRKEVERYLVLPPHASTAIALWCLHTWSLDAFFITPFLYVRSPQKRSGKSTLMIIVQELVRRSLLVTSASSAAIFRCIEEYRPTLLLDEADAWMRENEELRGILNGGHSRKTAVVIRTVGENYEIRPFSTFCPKAISGIGRLADTLEDRSIIIPMKRKHSQDRVERLREDHLDFLDLRRQCRRWAQDELETLRAADPVTPPTLNDRAADNWRQLLAVADTAGGEWPQQARAAAVALSGQTDDEAIGTQLLEDIRDYFASENAKAILSANLAEHLGKLEERPWSDWKQGKVITAPQIARLLKPFEIRPRTVRHGLLTAKGYLREQFEDAFGRYVQTSTQVVTPSQLRQSGSESDIPTRHNGLEAIRDTVTSPDERVAVTVTQKNCVTPKSGAGRYENRLCDGVTASTGATNDEETESADPEPL
jgi:putative DNA primase/helicase